MIVQKQFIPTIRHNGKTGNARKNFQPFSGNLKSLIHCKHRLRNRWISSRKEAVYNEYEVTRNKVKSEMTKLLRHEQQRISVDCKKTKLFWQYINKKINLKPIWQTSHGNEMLAQDDKEKAAALQDFFHLSIQLKQMMHMKHYQLRLMKILGYIKSLETGKLPADWELAEVTAIYKKGSKHDRSNYRPVSLTSVCCKILESLIRDHYDELFVG